MKIGLAQIRPRMGDIAANVTLHLEYIRQARAQGVELLIFPELSLTGYFLQDLAADVALRPNSPVLDPIREAGKDMDVVLGFVEEDMRHSLYISGMYLERGETRHIHRKVYLPTYGFFDDMRFYGCGSHIRAFDTATGRKAILICEDMFHPSTAIVASADGADYFIAISHGPGRGMNVAGNEPGSAESWDLLTRTYAQFFLSYVFFCNRVGFEDGINFFGGSCIVGPDGQMIAQGPYYDEALVVADIDPDALRRARMRVPLLRDERPELTLRELGRIVRAKEADPTGLV